MLCLHDADGDAFNLGGLRADNGLLLQRAGGWQKLHRPVSDPDVFAFCLVSKREQIIVEGGAMKVTDEFRAH